MKSIPEPPNISSSPPLPYIALTTEGAIHGERGQLERGRFNIRVSGGITDLGKVVIDAQSFAKPDSEKQ